MTWCKYHREAVQLLPCLHSYVHTGCFWQNRNFFFIFNMPPLILMTMLCFCPCTLLKRRYLFSSKYVTDRRMAKDAGCPQIVCLFLLWSTQCIPLSIFSTPHPSSPFPSSLHEYEEEAGEEIWTISRDIWANQISPCGTSHFSSFPTDKNKYAK